MIGREPRVQPPVLDLYSDMPLYNTKSVVHHTGVPAPTLRAWERRYGILSPRRSDNDYRVSIVDASTTQFDATAAGVPNGGAILVRPDGFVGFRVNPGDETTMDALDAHLTTYLIPNVAATSARATAAADPQ